MNREQQERNQEATIYIGNLDERVTDALVWELMLQAGPVANVHLPRDRISMSHQGFGFCEFLVSEDAEYACKIMNQIKMFGKPIRVNMASSDGRKPIDIGANLFIGNLDEGVTEELLYKAFSNFGGLTQQPKVARDDAARPKGYGFVSYDSFEAADQAIESLSNQYLMNKPITIQYAFKKEGKGERHGTPAERLLAANARKNNAIPLSFGIAPPPPMTGANAFPSYGGPPPGFAPMGQPQPGFIPPAPQGFA